MSLSSIAMHIIAKDYHDGTNYRKKEKRSKKCCKNCLMAKNHGIDRLVLRCNEKFNRKIMNHPTVSKNMICDLYKD